MPIPEKMPNTNKGFIERLSGKTMLNRAGNPKERIGALLLCSDASGFMTGRNVVADDGMT